MSAPAEFLRFRISRARGDVQGLGTRRLGYQRQGGRAARSSMVHAVTALVPVVRLFLQGTAFDIANKGSNRADDQASQHTIPEHWCAELSCSILLIHHLTCCSYSSVAVSRYWQNSVSIHISCHQMQKCCVLPTGIQSCKIVQRTAVTQMLYCKR